MKSVTTAVASAVASGKALLVGPVLTTIKATFAAAVAKLPLLGTLLSYFVSALKILVGSPVFLPLLKVVAAFIWAGFGDDGEEGWFDSTKAWAKVAIGWMAW